MGRKGKIFLHEERLNDGFCFLWLTKQEQMTHDLKYDYKKGILIKKWISDTPYDTGNSCPCFVLLTHLFTHVLWSSMIAFSHPTVCYT